jgi:hypothetical protein
MLFEKSDAEPDMRYSLALCEDEKYYLQQRREIAFEAIIKLLGDEKGPQILKQAIQHKICIRFLNY